MADTYELRDLDDDGQWDAFVAAAVGAHPFSRSGWLRAVQATFQAPVRRLVCLHNGRPQAAVSGIQPRRWHLDRLLTPDLAPHGGLLWVPPESDLPARRESELHHAAGLLAAELSARYEHVHLTHSPAVVDLRPFLWSGFTPGLRYTYRLPLGDAEALWQRLERRTRTVIRKAQDAGWATAPTTDVELFSGLYERVYAAQASPPPVPCARVRELVRRTLAAGQAQAVAVTSPAGQTAAVVVFVEDERRLYAWVAGAEPELGASGAVSLLYWEVLSRSRAAEFDFVGANLAAIARFKRGFGGDLVPYYTTEYLRGRWLRLLVPAARAWRG